MPHLPGESLWEEFIELGLEGHTQDAHLHRLESTQQIGTVRLLRQILDHELLVELIGQILHH